MDKCTCIRSVLFGISLRSNTVIPFPEAVSSLRRWSLPSATVFRHNQTKGQPQYFPKVSFRNQSSRSGFKIEYMYRGTGYSKQVALDFFNQDLRWTNSLEIKRWLSTVSREKTLKSEVCSSRPRL